jgi:hypothetical protein
VESRLVDYQRQIYNLQTHTYFLEKQLERVLTINPEV